MNVQLKPSGEHRCINFKLVEWKMNPESAFISDNSTHNAAIAEAMLVELHNLVENNVFEEINNDSQNYIDSKWDFAEKSDRSLT